jgi:hypothetical protein
MRRLWVLLILAGSVGLSAYTITAKWASHTALFYINPANLDNGLQSGRTDADVVAEILDAMTTWNTAGSDFRFQYGGLVSDTATGLDYRNVILFRPDGDGSAIATTYGWWNSATLEFLDVDIMFWDGPFAFYTDRTLCGTTAANPTTQTIANAAYIEDIATHELGHALGLNHTTVTDATMYPGYPYCSTWMRSLAADDLAGLLFLYPTTAPTPPPPPPPSGPVLTATGRKVKGSQVVDLAWSGLTAGTVTVYRNGGAVKVTANDGAESDALNRKGGGAYTYQVCDAVCTNTATVSF